jgi:hypothetical protein
MKRYISKIVLTAAVCAPLALLAVPLPASAATAHSDSFQATCSGTVQFITDGSGNPTGADYAAMPPTGKCEGNRLGTLAQLQGEITITGAAACTNGFTTRHNDTLTASDGSQLTVVDTESSCPRPNHPNIYDCSGTYNIVSGTGSFAAVTGGTGDWTGVVTLSTDGSGSGTFNSQYSGNIATG